MISSDDRFQEACIGKLWPKGQILPVAFRMTQLKIIFKVSRKICLLSLKDQIKDETGSCTNINKLYIITNIIIDLSSKIITNSIEFQNKGIPIDP